MEELEQGLNCPAHSNLELIERVFVNVLGDCV